MYLSGSHNGEVSMVSLRLVLSFKSSSRSSAHRTAHATYSSFVEQHQSSAMPIAVSKDLPTLFAWHCPDRVTTGTPMNSDSHVVVVPACHIVGILHIYAGCTVACGGSLAVSPALMWQSTVNAEAGMFHHPVSKDTNMSQ